MLKIAVFCADPESKDQYCRGGKSRVSGRNSDRMREIPRQRIPE
jgi:hypothetical protein